MKERVSIFVLSETCIHWYKATRSPRSPTVSGFTSLLRTSRFESSMHLFLLCVLHFALRLSSWLPDFGWGHTSLIYHLSSDSNLPARGAKAELSEGCVDFSTILMY